MRQAIVTKYHGPTNTRGSRIIATAAGGQRLTVEYDDALDSDANHFAAARALAGKMNWTGSWYGGGAQDGCVFVNAPRCDFTI